MKLAFTIIGACLFVLSGIAQSITVTGTIREANSGIVLTGVSVVDKKTGNGIIADNNGNFSIKVSNANTTLLFSLVGYTTVERAATTTMNVELAAAENILNDVVVTALGIQRNKKELGYSVQTVKEKDLTEVRQTNLVNGLAGRVAGLWLRMVHLELAPHHVLLSGAKIR